MCVCVCVCVNSPAVASPSFTLMCCHKGNLKVPRARPVYTHTHTHTHMVPYCHCLVYTPAHMHTSRIAYTWTLTSVMALPCTSASLSYMHDYELL